MSSDAQAQDDRPHRAVNDGPNDGRGRKTMIQTVPTGSLTAALTRYRVLAYATGVFLLLLTLHLIVQTIQWRHGDIPFSQQLGLGKWLPGGQFWIPAGHGWLYLSYVIASLDLWMRTRLPFFRMLLVVLAGTVPGMSFVAEHWVTSRVRPMVEAVVERPVQDVAAS